MVEWYDETRQSFTEPVYAAHKNESFPQLEKVINIKTGPTFSISITIYPSFKEAKQNLGVRGKMVELMKPHM